MKTLRWITVLPAAILAYFAVQLLGVAWMSFSDMPSFYKQAVNSIAGGCAFVYAGIHVSPAHLKRTGTVLAILFAMIQTGFAVWVMMADKLWSYWDLICIALGVASAVIYCLTYETSKPPQEPSQVTGWN